jgi:hypothetical protein
MLPYMSPSDMSPSDLLPKAISGTRFLVFSFPLLKIMGRIDTLHEVSKLSFHEVGLENFPK